MGMCEFFTAVFIKVGTHTSFLKTRSNLLTFGSPANFPVPATPTPCSQSALGVLMVYAPFPSVPYSVHALCKIDFLPKIISRAFGAHIYTYEHSFGLSQVRRPQADHV